MQFVNFIKAVDSKTGPNIFQQDTVEKSYTLHKFMNAKPYIIFQKYGHFGHIFPYPPRHVVNWDVKPQPKQTEIFFLPRFKSCLFFWICCNVYVSKAKRSHIILCKSDKL